MKNPFLFIGATSTLVESARAPARRSCAKPRRDVRNFDSFGLILPSTLPTLGEMTLVTFRRHRVLFIASLIAASSCVLLPRIAQNPAYHAFADGRGFLGVPNFFDVFSNVPFLIAAIVGFWRLATLPVRPQHRLPLIVFCIGLAATSMGSAYYHWFPTNDRLFWDRLPMTIAFMGFFSFLLIARVCEKWGRRLLFPLILLGVFSVVFWRTTENAGFGDLRPYLVVQFGMIALSLLILWLYPGRTPSWRAIGPLLLGYALAKVTETFDQSIFQLTAEIFSGHSIKHLLAALGAVAFAYYAPADSAADSPRS
jgi:hypothetical protein